ncbi:MAG: hypothetical protein ACREQM_16060 [Candidatus Dormibacteraceae bacterium]
MKFYNLRTKESTEVPETQIKKRRTKRTTSRGIVQERYAAVAEVEASGSPVTLYKFIDKKTFDTLKVPEVD